MWILYGLVGSTCFHYFC
uniref:Uncharacterized protein n=1 Tax=Rhizophora mucronata TaxID=61149 RepID=A0A2P2NRL3_RHIMU